jgi:hypothetical protein
MPTTRIRNHIIETPFVEASGYSGDQKEKPH